MKNRMKLTLTADELARYHEAERLLGEINASWRERDEPVHLCIALGRDGLLIDPDGRLLVSAPGA